MNNQNDDITLAYLAGLFEGEGCAHISRKRKDNGLFCYSCGLYVQMTDIEPVLEFYNYFGENVDFHMKRGGENCREQFRWRVDGKRAGHIALQLLPFINTPRKRSMLECIINFSNLVTKTGIHISPDNLAEREVLYQKGRRYNKRGLKAGNRSDSDIERIHSLKPKVSFQLLLEFK